MTVLHPLRVTGVQPAESSESYYCEDRRQAWASEKEGRNTAQIVMIFTGKLQEGSLDLGGPRAHSVHELKLQQKETAKIRTWEETGCPLFICIAREDYFF
jgi:hypothetical protein